MFAREKFVLELIRREGKITRLRLQKLCFVAAAEETLPAAANYEFVPFRFGPYSFTLAHDITRMRAANLITVDGNQFAIGSAAPQSKGHPVAEKIAKRFQRVSTADLVATVYKRYPWFTANATDSAKRTAHIPTVSPAVYTIGYQDASADGLFDALLRHGIRRLIDVRKNPVSRRFGFHKGSLLKIAGRLGITYDHVPELGVPSDLRQELNSIADYKDLFREYRATIIPGNIGQVDKVADWIRATPSAILCREADPKMCHRSELATVIARRTQLPVVHLSAKWQTSSNELKF